MVNQRYSIAMAETLHYLKGISEKDVKKIPNKFLEFLKLNSSKEYECNFDYTKPLNELELRDETRGLIAIICLNYWCETEEQKNNFIKHLSYNENKYQEELRKKYDINNIFKQNKVDSKDEVIEEGINTSNLPIEIKKEKFYKKLINLLKKILKIK